MVNITHKNTTLRIAIAEAIVRTGSLDTIRAIEEDRVPKGNVFAMSKAAGLLGVKQTANILPDCHPLPIEFTAIRYEIKGQDIHIYVEVHTIYKTGVEVEAMHGASVVALNIYDMLKPIDKNVEIGTIRLLKKRGGKSDFRPKNTSHLQAAVIVCSDSVSAGLKEDRAGKAICEELDNHQVKVVDYSVLADELESIQAKLTALENRGVNLIIFTGGTGLSPRDVSPEAIRPLLDRSIPGIEEQIRRYGQQRMPYAMLSRSVAGTIGNSLVLALPGSTKGARESMQAIFPQVLHIFGVLKGQRHD